MYLGLSDSFLIPPKIQTRGPQSLLAETAKIGCFGRGRAIENVV